MSTMFMSQITATCWSCDNTFVLADMVLAVIPHEIAAAMTKRCESEVHACSCALHTAAHLVHSWWLQAEGCILAGKVNRSEACSCLLEPRAMSGLTQ